MPQANTGFASVKLPATLVDQAREAAQPMRRSVAGVMSVPSPRLGRALAPWASAVAGAANAINKRATILNLTRDST